MKLKIFQKGFNYSQDGPGNRLVYHLQGCNMCCPWCANPEGMSKEGTLMTHESKKEYFSCKEFEVDVLIDEVKRSRMLFYDGGGVTLSGGEVSMQFDGVKEFLKRVKELGIHTAIETNGSHPHLVSLFPYIDFLIIDLKHYDDEIHAKETGISNKRIKENIALAFHQHPKVLIRIPVIKGFNDKEEDIRNFITFFKQYDTSQGCFEFLRYHEYGKAKWLQCGMTYKMKDAYPDPETLSLYSVLFKENGLQVIHT